MRVWFNWFSQVLLICLLCQCSSYSQKFKRALDAQEKSPKDLTGAWSGTWKSHTSNHHGKLQAIVSRLTDDSESEQYQFHYRATWAGFLSGGFRTIHTIEKQPDGKSWKVSGSQKLPWYYGGTYTYEGKTTLDEFEALYRCDWDKGVFSLVREKHP